MAGIGTQSNMNVNEVIANRSHVIMGGKLTDKIKNIHPNDDVNKSQSSNDTFPTAMNMSAYHLISSYTIPCIEKLAKGLKEKTSEFKDVVKIGRTHFMDATPLTLGMEFSGYLTQVENSIKNIKESLNHCGTSTRWHCSGNWTKYAKRIFKISKWKDSEIRYKFKSAKNKFDSGANDAMVKAQLH